MSNHSGGRMLNKVLFKAEELGILEIIGQEEALEFALEVTKIGRGYDCNNGEVLDEIGQRLGLCYCCLEKSDDIKDELCPKCSGRE